MERIYGAYGTHSPDGHGPLAYTGERAESDTGWYLLGKRPYSPVLRRFLAPDTMSPFDAGGINRYAYCGGDPFNRVDPSGHVSLTLKSRLLGRDLQPPMRVAVNSVATSAGELATIEAPYRSSPPMEFVYTMSYEATNVSASTPHNSGRKRTAGHALFGQLSEAGPSKRQDNEQVDRPGEDSKRVGNIEPGSPAERRAMRRDAKKKQPYLRLGDWDRRKHPEAYQSYVWTSTEVTMDGYELVLNHESKEKGIGQAFVYIRRKKRLDGSSIDPTTGRHLDADFVRDHETSLIAAGQRQGVKVTLQNTMGWAGPRFRARLRRNGTHIIHENLGPLHPLIDDELGLVPGSRPLP